MKNKVTEIDIEVTNPNNWQLFTYNEAPEKYGIKKGNDTILVAPKLSKEECYNILAYIFSLEEEIRDCHNVMNELHDDQHELEARIVNALYPEMNI